MKKRYAPSPYYTYYRLNSTPLLMQYLEQYCRTQQQRFSRRFLSTLIIHAVSSLDARPIFLSSYQDYENFIRTLCSKKASAVTLYFSNAQWEQLSGVQALFNINMGDFMRLALSSYCFTQGTAALPLRLIAAMLCVKTCQYVIPFTEPVCALFVRMRRSHLPLSRSAVIRAACLFYASSLGSAVPLVNSSLYRVDNTKTRWERVSFRCGPEMKRFIDREKQNHHAPVPVVISHLLYSFLQEA
jgi:hypothetical protein